MNRPRVAAGVGRTWSHGAESKRAAVAVAVSTSCTAAARDPDGVGGGGGVRDGAAHCGRSGEDQMAQRRAAEGTPKSAAS